MRKGFIFFVGFTIFIFGSCGSYVKKVAPIYESFKFDTEITENEEVANIDIKNTSFPLSLVWFKEFERTFIKVNDEFLLIDMAWELNEELNPEIDILFLFDNKDEYFLLFPTYTEEFPTLGLVSISKNGTFNDLGFHTYSFSDFKIAKDEMLNGNYLLNEVNDTVRVLLDSNPKVMLSNRFYSDYPGNSISKREKSILQALLSNETIDFKDDNYDASIVETYNFDIDNDGVLDKINVRQKKKVLDDFDRQHFGLSIEIFKGEGNGLEEWKESDCIFEVQNNCLSEGFSVIHFTDQSFTVSQQACYDYTFLVNSSATFIVIDNEIYLEQYREEYFNKANHEQKIPTKTWTEVEFGKVKFENVTEEFLLNLRF